MAGWIPQGSRVELLGVEFGTGAHGGAPRGESRRESGLDDHVSTCVGLLIKTTTKVYIGT